MRKNTLKKAMAVMISATMLVTGYTVVSAEGFTDAEALAEMDANNRIEDWEGERHDSGI